MGDDVLRQSYFHRTSEATSSILTGPEGFFDPLPGFL